LKSTLGPRVIEPSIPVKFKSNQRWTSLVPVKMRTVITSLFLVIGYWFCLVLSRVNHIQYFKKDADPREEPLYINGPGAYLHIFHSAKDGTRAYWPWPGTKYYHTTRSYAGFHTTQFAGKSEFEEFLRKKKDTITTRWTKYVSNLISDKRILEVTSFSMPKHPSVGKIVRKAGQILQITQDKGLYYSKKQTYEEAHNPPWVIYADIFWFKEHKAVGCHNKSGRKGAGTCWRRWNNYMVDGRYCYPRYGFWSAHNVECTTHYDCIMDHRVLDYTCWNYHLGNSKADEGL